MQKKIYNLQANVDLTLYIIIIDKKKEYNQSKLLIHSHHSSLGRWAGENKKQQHEHKTNVWYLEE